MKARKLVIEPHQWTSFVRPTSALSLIASLDIEGNTNAAPFATLVRVNQNPLEMAFTCAEGGDTHRNIVCTEEYTINLVSFEQELLQKVLIAAKPWPCSENELLRAELTALPSRVVAPPIIEECYAHLELKLEWTRSWSKRCMIVGRVVAVSANADCIDEYGEVIWERARPTGFWGSSKGASFSALAEPLLVTPPEAQ